MPRTIFFMQNVNTHNLVTTSNMHGVIHFVFLSLVFPLQLGMYMYILVVFYVCSASN